MTGRHWVSLSLVRFFLARARFDFASTANATEHRDATYLQVQCARPEERDGSLFRRWVVDNANDFRSELARAEFPM